MAQDSMRNLGYQEPEQQPPLKSDASTGRSDLLATFAEKPAEAAGK